MQCYSAKVHLGRPDIAPARPHIIEKEGLTAAEIMLLQHDHGADAVTDITDGPMDKRPHAEEFERLTLIYGGKAMAEVFGPGGSARLPVKLNLGVEAEKA